MLMRNQPINVLVVDDELPSYTMIKNFLTLADPTGFNVEWVASYNEALPVINQQIHDVYLFDHRLGDYTGVGLLNYARERGFHKPMILITGITTLELDTDAVQVGAADYLDKTELTPSILSRSIRYALDRARYRAELQASEERYRDLFENATDLIQSVDQDGMIGYVNRAWLETLGYNAQEARQFSIFDIIHPDHLAECKTIFEQVLSGGESHNLETVFLAHDGRSVIVEGNVNARIVDGKAYTTRGIFRDITERKQSEEMLRKLSQALEQSNAPIMITSPSGKIEYINSHFTQLVGYTLEEIYDRTARFLRSPQAQTGAYRKMFEALQFDGHWEGELLVKKKDGESFWASVHVSPVKDEQDATTHFVTVAEDISERKRTLEALQESERQFRDLFEQKNDGVFLISMDLHYLKVNQRGADMLGYTIDELIGNPIKDVVAPHEYAHTLAIAEALHEGKKVDPYERIFRHKDGTEFPVEVNVQTVYDLSGKPRHIQSVVRDISERKRAEQIERDQRALLEALLNTAAILNSTFDIENVMDRILISVKRVVPYEMGHIALIENGIARVIRDEGYENISPGEAFQHSNLEIAKTPSLKTMIETQQPLLIPDIHQDPNWINIPQLGQVRSYAGSPIIIDGETIGFLNLLGTKANAFTPDILKRLQAFGNQIAVAIKNARQRNQAQELAAVNERERLARDLHDAVSQTLFSASLIAETMPRVWKDIPEGMEEELMELHHLTRQALAEMRSLLLELRPHTLIETSIRELINQLAEAFRRREHIAVQVTVDGQFTFPPDVQIAFFRITQECLNNISKHAQATQVDITLQQTGGSVMLQVCDNGHGFDPGNIPSDHHGVRIMSERAKSINATLDIISQPSQGTEIRLTWSSG